MYLISLEEVRGGNICCESRKQITCLTLEHTDSNFSMANVGSLQAFILLSAELNMNQNALSRTDLASYSLRFPYSPEHVSNYEESGSGEGRGGAVGGGDGGHMASEFEFH